ncbi:MAG: ABC-2 type transport system permease protein [Psychromonas sp.]|jgi:ABC-2 type transport system permease protein|uniref:hypothetical protein n=1 Tax=Psychromonas sp. TaxID=1884585 RepID=UPI0039E67BA9
MHPGFFMLEKELLEHKIVTRLPLFLLLMGLVILAAIVFNTHSFDNISVQFNYQGDMSQRSVDVTQGIRGMLSLGAGAVSLLLSTLYLAKTFRKERQEGSLMFWRSMPVSEGLTHTVKLGFALILIPLICSFLVLCGELFFYLISFTQSPHLMAILGDISFATVALNWLMFIAKMVLISLAMLPVACLLLAVSQLVNYPLLAVTLGVYTVKLFSTYLFAFDGVATFIGAISSMPLALLTSAQPLAVFAQVGWFSCLLAYLLGALCLMLSLSIRKYGELDIRALFSR